MSEQESPEKIELPSVEELKRLAAAALKLIDAKSPQIERYLASSFPYFLQEVVYTFDPHKPAGQQVNHFPKYLALKEIAWTIQHSPLTAMYKSRQLMASWMLAAYALWVCFYRGSSAYVVIQSRTEDEAKDLLKRVVFTYNCLPEWLRTRHKLIRGPTETDMRFRPLGDGGPGARIIAVAQGADIIRSRTPSVVLSDEMAFQDEFEDAYGAIRPAVDGGGQWIGVSTPNGREELGARLWHDDPDTYHPAFARSYKAEIDVCRGLQITFNRNGLVAIRYHYTSWPSKDPARTKEGYDWYVRSRAGVTKEKWKREHEIDFDTMEGEPVYGSTYKRVLHTRARIEPEPNVTVIRGWDYGYRHPACVMAQKTEDDRLLVFFELVGKNIPIQVFADAVLWVCGSPLTTRGEMRPDFLPAGQTYIDKERALTEYIRLEKLTEYINDGHILGYSSFDELPRFDFGASRFRDWDDPAGSHHDDKGEESSKDILFNRGIRTLPGELRKGTRINAVRDMLLPRRGDNRAWLIISRERCPYLIKGMEGGYHFKKDKETPEKNIYSHPHDALQYLVTGEFDFDREEQEKPEDVVGSFAWLKKMEMRRRLAELEV